MNDKEHPLLQLNTSLRLSLARWSLKAQTFPWTGTSDQLLTASDPENKLPRWLGQCQPKLKLSHAYRLFPAASWEEWLPNAFTIKQAIRLTPLHSTSRDRQLDSSNWLSCPWGGYLIPVTQSFKNYTEWYPGRSHIADINLAYRYFQGDASYFKELQSCNSWGRD